MMSGCLGISCKVAALLFVAWLVQQVALKTGKTNYQPLVSSRIHGVALCPCDKRIKVKVCTEALWYNTATASYKFIHVCIRVGS
jgi:hypothetical protein